MRAVAPLKAAPYVPFNQSSVRSPRAAARGQLPACRISAVHTLRGSPMNAVSMIASLAAMTLVPAHSHAQDARVTRTATTSCAAIASIALPDVRITAATAVPAAERRVTVPHCKVVRRHRPRDWLRAAPARRLEPALRDGRRRRLRRAASTTRRSAASTRAMRRRTTDTGHRSKPFQASWALDDLERQVNFGHLAVHRTAAVAKAIIQTYYAAAPRYNYFVGCSNGGRQALMEAQRYPEDFDGIVSGAPALNFSRHRRGLHQEHAGVISEPGVADRADDLARQPDAARREACWRPATPRTASRTTSSTIRATCGVQGGEPARLSRRSRRAPSA